MKKMFVRKIRAGVVQSLTQTLRAYVGAKVGVKNLGRGVVLITEIQPQYVKKVENFLQGVQNFFGK